MSGGLNTEPSACCPRGERGRWSALTSMSRVTPVVVGSRTGSSFVRLVFRELPSLVDSDGYQRFSSVGALQVGGTTTACNRGLVTSGHRPSSFGRDFDNPKIVPASTPRPFAKPPRRVMSVSVRSAGGRSDGPGPSIQIPFDVR